MTSRSVLTAVLVAALGGVLTGACAPLSPAAPPAPPPKIVFDTSTYDFGVLAQGAPAAHAYAFTNAGALPLYVENLRTSCGCTATVNGARMLAPGAASAIAVTCETDASSGPQNRTVTVYSNDPAQPVSTLTVTGRINAALFADPPRLYVGHLRRGQSGLRSVRLGGAALSQVGAIQTSGKSIDASRSDERERGLRIGAKQDAPLGTFTDRVMLYGGDSPHPLLTVPVSGVVDGDVTISPAQVHFGTVTPSAKTARVVDIQTQGQPFHLSAVHLTPEVGTAVVSPVREGAEYRVTVTLGEGLRAGRISAILEIDTDNPEQPRMQVPCVGRVVEKS